MDCIRLNNSPSIEKQRTDMDYANKELGKNWNGYEEWKHTYGRYVEIGVDRVIAENRINRFVIW